MDKTAFGAEQAFPTLMVIDARVDAAEILTRDLVPTVRVLHIDETTDAWAAITSDLEKKGPVQTLALFAHGHQGAIALGAETLTEDVLRIRSADFAQLRAALASEAQVLLYACRVGAEDRRLMDAMSAHLGCPVAASSHLVGAEDLGGSWDLDLQTGPLPRLSATIWHTGAPLDYPDVLETRIVGTSSELLAALRTNSVREIILTADITLTGGNVAERSTGNDVAIRSEGDNRYTISGNGQTSGLISLGDKAVLEIDNVDVTRFTGRVIESDGGYVNISNSAFSSNAGAISTTRGSYVNLYNASFDGHNSTRGGAIYLDDTYMVAINTEFTNNTTRSFAAGGAIYDDGDSTIYLIDVDFSDNRGLPLTLGNSNNIGTDRGDDTHITIIGGNLVKDATGGYEGIFQDANVLDQFIEDDGTIDWKDAGIEFLDQVTTFTWEILNPFTPSEVGADPIMAEDSEDGGPSTGVLTITLPEPAGSRGAEVLFEILQEEQDAVIGEDYILTGATQVSGSLYMAFIPEDGTVGRVTFEIINDVDREPDTETIRINPVNQTELDNGRLYYVVDPRITFETVLEDSDQPVVSLAFADGADGVLIEGEDYTGLEIVTDLLKDITVGVEITYAVADENAAVASEVDFRTITKTVSFSIPQDDDPNVDPNVDPYRVILDLTAEMDMITEDAESFTVSLKDQDVLPGEIPFYRIEESSRSVELTIAANGQEDLFDVALEQAGDGTVLEGEDSSAITVQLYDPVEGGTKVTENDLLITYQISGTATFGEDHNAPGTTDSPLTGQVIVPAGTSSAVINLRGLGDNIFEEAESLTITLDAGPFRETYTYFDTERGENGEDVTVPRNYDVRADSATQTITILDDDAPGVVIRQLTDTTTETGGEARFEITLTSEPEDYVLVALDTDDDGEVRISQELPLSGPDLPLDLRTLLFFLRQDEDAGNYVLFRPTVGDDLSDYNTPKVLIVTGQDDNEDDENVLVTFTPTVVSNDSVYASLSDADFAFTDATGAERADLSVTNFDDDGASVSVSNITGILDEDDLTAVGTYTLSLGQAPAGDVTIAIDAGEDAEVSVDGGVRFAQTASLILADTNAASILVRAVNDATIEGGEFATITHQITSGPAPYTADLAIPSVDLQVSDNDVPVVTIGEVGDGSEENNVKAIFALELDAAPPIGGTTVKYRVDVTETTRDFDGQSAELAVGDVDYSALTGEVFFAGPRLVDGEEVAGETLVNVEISPFDDGLDELPFEFVGITLLDGDDDTLGAVQTQTVKIWDDDQAGLRIGQSLATPLVEENGSYYFDVSLTSVPTDDVEVTLTATGGVLFESGLREEVVFFKGRALSEKQRIVIEGIDNDVPNDDDIGAISYAVRSGDLDYEGKFGGSFDVVIENDDLGGIALNAPADFTVTEGGAPDTYTLTLQGIPSADVLVAIDGTGLSFTGENVDPNGLFILNGDRPSQTITVTADNDDIDNDDRDVQIKHIVTSLDQNYAVQTIPDINVKIIEDDVAAFFITETDGDTVVTEGEPASDSYSFRLGSQPRTEVIVTFDASTLDGAEGEVSFSLNGEAYGKTAEVTFNAYNWDEDQTITIETDLDDFIAGDPRDAIITHTMDDDASEEYAELGSVPSVNVSVVEDDFVGIAVGDTDGFTEVTTGPGGGDTILVSLTSQPLADVVVTFDTGNEFKPLDPITFTSQNWDDAIERVVELDFEPGFGIQTFDIEMTARSGDPSDPESPDKKYTFTDTVGIAVNNVDRDELADGFEDAMNALDGLFQSALDFDFPLFDLDAVAPDFISVFIDDAVAAFRNDPAGSFDALGESIEFAIEGAFGEVGIPITADLSVSNIAFDEVEFALALENQFNTSADISADFGIPAIGIDIDGEVEAGFKYAFDMAFGLSKDDGFFLNSDGTHFLIEATAGVSDDFEATGSVGFLGIAATNNVDDNGNGMTGGNVNFTVDLNAIDDGDPETDDKRVSVSEIKETGLSDAFSVGVSGGVGVGLNVVTSLGGSTVLPSVGFDLNGTWSAFDDTDGEFTLGGAPSISFDDITLDAGSFITDFAAPIFIQIDEIVSPFQPIIDFLQAPIEPLEKLEIKKINGGFIVDSDGNITVASLASGLSGGYIEVEPYITAIDDLAELINLAAGYSQSAVDNDTNIEIVLGSYALDLPDEGFDAAEGEEGFEAAQNAVRNNSSSSGADETTNSKIDKATSDQGTRDILKGLTSSEVFKFPIFTDVEEVFGLITGKTDVTLFQADLPEFGIGAEVTAGYDFLDLFGITLDGFVDVAVNLGFGFDTQGFSDWADTGYALDKSYLIFDGFYVSDTRDGEDIDEITADLGLSVTGKANAFVASGRVSAGIVGDAAVDFRDTGEGTGQADGKIRAISEIGANFLTPQNLIEFDGSVDAFLSARASAFGKTVFRESLSEELLSISFGEDGLVISTAFDGPIAGGIAFFDANFNGIRDADEPFTLTDFNAENPDVNGDFELAISLENFDDNGNGKIDFSEGQIVVEGGIDTDTDDDQRVVYVASPDWGVVSPLTRLALELNPVDLGEVERWIEDAFGLPAGFDLQEDSPLDGIRAGNADAAQAFALLAQLQNLIILGANTMGESTAAAPERLFDPTIETEAAPTERADGARAIIAELGARVQNAEQIDLTDSATLTGILTAVATAIGVTPAGLDAAVADLVTRNTAIAEVGAADVTDAASGEAARAAMADQVALDALDLSYNSLLSDVFERLIGASTPEPDFTEVLQQIETALDLPTGTDITTFNPVDAVEEGGDDAEAGLEVFAAQVKVNATLIQLANAGAGGDTEMAVKALVETIAENDTPVDLGDADVITDLLQRVDDSLDAEIVEAAAFAIAESNAQIDDLVENVDPATPLSEVRSAIVEVQTFAQGEQSALLTDLTDGTTAPQTFAELLQAAKLVDDDGFLFYATDEDTPLAVNLLAEIEDQLEKDVTIVEVNGAEVGTPILFDREIFVTLNADGDLSFDPTGAFEDLSADDSLLQTLTFTVEGAEGEQFEAGLGLTLKGVNDAPIGTDDEGFETITTTPLVISAAALLANDTDAEGDTLTLSTVTSGTGGTASLTETGDVAFVADPDFTGTATFAYTVTDPSGAEGVAQVAVEVKPEPIITELVALNDWYNPSWGGGYIASFDITLNAAVIGASVSDWQLTAQLAEMGDIVGGWLTGYNAPVTFDATSDTYSTEGHSYRLALSQGDTLQVNVHVQGAGYEDGDLAFVFSDLDVNTAPVAENDGGFAVTAGAALEILAADLLANDGDADGDPLVITDVASVLGGQATLSGDGSITFAADADFAGTASFEYTASDGFGGSATARVSVDVEDPGAQSAIDIALVALNDWYHPSHQGGYIATFDIALNAGAILGDTASDWALEAHLSDAGDITHGWVDGHNATVSFDAATDTFDTLGQAHQHALSDGSVLRVNVQVDGSGYDAGDIAFIFRDLDPSDMMEDVAMAEMDAVQSNALGSQSDLMDILTSYTEEEPAPVGADAFDFI